MVLSVYIALNTFFAQFYQLEELPLFDHMPELRSLYAQGRYDDAVRLGSDMLESGFYRGVELEELLAKSRKKSGSAVGNSVRFLRGFVSGKSDTAADAMGAVVSDLLVYGDVRDVLVQTGLWAAGRENDPFLLAVSGAGILFEALPLADMFPALLKYFYRTGSLTTGFTRHVTGAIKNFKSAESRKLFADMLMLWSKSGINRSVRIMKHVENPAQLSRCVRLTQESSAKLHLAVNAVGGEVLKCPVKVSPKNLLNAALRGRAGMLTLKRQKMLIVIKVFSSGRFASFIRHGAQESVVFKHGAYCVAALLFLCGSVVPGYTIMKKIRKKIEKQD